jgi:hypothetical protein
LSNASSRGTGTDFDEWLRSMVGEHREFTALVILAKIDERSITPLCSTFMHVIGDETDWSDIKAMFAGSGKTWDGAAFFPTKARDGGLIDNETARRRLGELQAKVTEDRMTLNEGHFFDVLGRRIKVEPLLDA